MKKINKVKKINFFLTLLLAALFILSFSIFSTGCSKSVANKTDTSLSEAQASNTISSTENQSDTGSSNSTSSSSSTTIQPATTAEQIPADIKDMISKADAYFNNGQYAEAVSSYRSIKPAVEKNTGISDSLKQEIINSYTKNFEASRTITETARMHYGNAMQLEYEKRIDEAIKELEEALRIYPKYQDAIDKLDSIRSLYKLK
jgi:tetratricopeptide (TPR) repeat protein